MPFIYRSHNKTDVFIVFINKISEMKGEQTELHEYLGEKDKLNSKPDNDGDKLELVLSYVGDMGLYQKLLFLMMLPIGFFYAWIYYVQMFIAVTPQNHWCRIPELANLSMELRRNLSAPGASTGDWDRCMTFDTNWTRILETLIPPPDGTPKISCQHGWEFEFNDIPYETIVSERGWVCDNASNVPIAQTMFFIGSIVGGILIGWTADYFGRVPALMGANLIAGIGGVATIFTTGLWDFVFCRFLVGISMDTAFMIPYILLLEYVGPRYRTLVANISIALFYGAGALSVPALAYYIANWRKFAWATSLPMFIVLLAPWLVPESARWLVSRGRVVQAAKVLRKIASVNKTQIPDDVMEDFIVSSKSGQEKMESLLTLMKSPSLRKAMVYMMILYMASAAVFDGLVRLSDSFGLDYFITFTFTSATEIPSILLVAIVLDRWGRRNLTWAPLMLAGISILSAVLVPKGIIRATLAITARFFINMSFTALVQWTTEILPTPFRASASSLLHIIGFVATTTTPFIVYSERFWSVLPLIILGILCFVSAGVSLPLPETKGLPMPQTIADGEKIIREQSLCGKPEDVDDDSYIKKP